MSLYVNTTRGRSCISKNAIHVVQTHDAVAILTLNQWAKSCSSKDRLNLRNNSLTGSKVRSFCGIQSGVMLESGW